MRRKTKTKQIFETIAVMTIIALVFYVILFIQIKEKNKIVSALTNETESIIKKETKLRSVKKLVRDIERERNIIDSYFITNDNIVDFIEIIENFGKRNGLSIEITSVKVDDINSVLEKKVKTGELLYVNFKTKGHFGELFQFLSILENLPFKIDLLNIDFKKPSGISGQDKDMNLWSGFFNISVAKFD